MRAFGIVLLRIVCSYIFKKPNYGAHILFSELLCAVKDRVEWKSLEPSRGDWNFWLGGFYFLFPRFRLSDEVKEHARLTVLEIYRQHGFTGVFNESTKRKQTIAEYCDWCLEAAQNGDHFEDWKKIHGVRAENRVHRAVRQVSRTVQRDSFRHSFF